jgi:hypothetical protein
MLTAVVRAAGDIVSPFPFLVSPFPFLVSPFLRPAQTSA